MVGIKTPEIRGKSHVGHSSALNLDSPAAFQDWATSSYFVATSPRTSLSAIFVRFLASLIQTPGPVTMETACLPTPYFPSSSSRRAFGKHGQKTPQRWSIGRSCPRSIIRQEKRFRPFVRGDRELTLSQHAPSPTLYFGIKDVPESKYQRSAFRQRRRENQCLRPRSPLR